MTIELNHTIIWSHDKHRNAEFWADVLGLPIAGEFGPFVQIKTGNDVDLDFATADENEEIPSQHYAFLVSEEEFDHGFNRIKELGLDFWADPRGDQKGKINDNDGGRGVYFSDLSGHNLELITKPYGAGDNSLRQRFQSA